MTRLVLARVRCARALCGALVVALAGIALAAAQDQPVFRSEGEIVRVFTTVTDRDGRLVTTLKQADFEVRDEGKPQPITVFDNTPRPIQLVVMLDVSGSMVGNLPVLRAASDQLFARLGKEDVARVGTFGKDVVLSPTFTRDRAELRAALPREIDPQAPTPLWRAVDDSMAIFDTTSDRRRVILVLSDGKDSGPTSFRQKMLSPIDIIERARKEDVMIYAVGMRSRSQRPMQPGLGADGLQAMLAADLPDPGLARVAEETGGGYLELRANQNLEEAFAQVADELHSQYLLGYAPPKRDGKVHEIDVKVSQKGMKSRARKSYVAPSPSPS